MSTQTSSTSQSNSIAEVSADRDHPTVHHQAPYLLFILLVSSLAFSVLAADIFVDSNSETGRILRYADTLLCVLFFGDFLHCLIKADKKLRYLVTWGWLDLISCIPAIDALRWGRASRLVRVLRVLRGIRSARILIRFILAKRAQSAALAASLASVIVIALASIAILRLEESAGAKANIRTAEDAIWWSFVTITTVGYGDHYPVTAEGRLVAAGLMAIGVGLIGTWAGMAASWFLAPGEATQSDDIHLLRREIRELRQTIESHCQNTRTL